MASVDRGIGGKLAMHAVISQAGPDPTLVIELVSGNLDILDQGIDQTG